jgi:hypothetical protein
VDYEKRDINFLEADSRYAELKRQLDAGSISNEEFDAQLQQLTVQDNEGRLWVKSRKTGEWHYHDGRAWTRGTPPGYQPPAASTPDPQSQPEPGEQLLPSQTPLPGSAATQGRERGKQRRDVLYGALLTAGILVAVGMMLWRLMPGAPDGGGSPPEKASDARGSAPEEASKVAPGYSRFEHDSGALWVEVPSEWDERVIVDEEGEKGRASWSAFLGEGESAGPSMTAVNDLYSWRNGTPGHQGVYVVASKGLAQKYTDDELVTSGPNDYSSSCEGGTPRDFERPPYSGKVLEWNNCGGDSDHSSITLAAAPKDRECVILAQVGGYFQTQTDLERRLHTLNTLETDCSRID